MTDNATTDFVRGAQDIVHAGQRMDARGWVPATAGNISCRLPDGRIAITRSGCHKGFLTEADVITVDLAGQPHQPQNKPSAETLLHCQVYRLLPDVGAVLHGHSVASTVLSMTEPSPALTLQDYEVQKVFEGQTTHDASVRVPLLPTIRTLPVWRVRLSRTLPTCPQVTLFVAMVCMCGARTWPQPLPGWKGWSSCWPVFWREGSWAYEQPECV